MSKQTVWLITMLSIMVVLSAYYIVTGPVEPADNMVDSGETDTTDNGDVDVSTEETSPLKMTLFGPDDAEDIEATDEGKASEDSKDNEDEASSATQGNADMMTAAGKDYFLKRQLERQTINSQLIDKYTAAITDPELEEAKLQETKQKLEDLQTSISQIDEMEELIRGEGFNDALVVSDNGQYDITVQADELTRAEVIDVMELINEKMNIAATKLTVSYHP